MDVANIHNLGAGETAAPTTANAGAVSWRQQDYSWTHSAPVEGFFVILTIVIVPVAILRWLRSLRDGSFAVDDRRRRDASS
jgi:hypothetical protein